MSDQKKDSGVTIGGFQIGFGPATGPTGTRAAEDAEGRLRREAEHKETEVADGPLEAKGLDDKGAFRIVFVAPLTPDPELSLGAPPPPTPLPVDKYTFDTRFKELSPAFVVVVPDPFDLDGEALRFDLRLSELRALRPDGLIEAAPPLRALVEARKVVLGIRGRTLSPEDGRRALERILPRKSWAKILTPEVVERVVAPPTADSSLGGLLDQVDVAVPVAEPAEPARASEGGMSDLLAAVARTARGPGQRPAGVGSALERLDAAIATLLTVLYAHPEVARLERAWRSARLLVDRLDFRAGVELDLLPAHPADVEEALARLSRREGEEGGRAPVDLIVVDPPLDTTPRDFDRLEAWAKLAESLRAVLLVQGTPGHLGFDDFAALQRTERRLEANDEPRARALRAFGAHDESRWVAMSINPFVLRNAFTKETSRLRELAFAEPEGAHVFGNPSIAVAVLAAQSWVRNGWPTELVGPRAGVFENLPVHQLLVDGVEIALPMQSFVSSDTQRAVARAGVLLLASAANHDAAIVAAAPVLFRGKETEVGPDAPANARLGDQLFVARLSHVVEQLAAALPSDAPATAVRDVVRLTLAELFKAGGKRVDVDVEVRPDVLSVTVRPGGFAGISLPEVGLAARRG